MDEKLLLFTPIFSSTAERLVTSMNEVPQNQDIEFWINSPGGGVFAGWSIIGAMNERSLKGGKNTAKVLGDASSMITYMLLFMDNVEAIDVSNFTFHRADGYTDTDEEKSFLARVNNDLRKKLEKKINSEVFKEVTGYSFDDIFDPEKRINVNLTAKQAKQIGLIDKVIRLEPKQIAAFEERFIGFHSFDTKESVNSHGSEENGKTEKTEKVEAEKDNLSINKKSRKMTKEEIKAQLPDVYAEIQKEGVSKEKDRVEAILEFVDIDPEACKKLIESGENPTAKFFAQMSRKGMAQNALKDSKEESTEKTEIPKDEPKAQTEDEKAMAEAEKEVFAAAGIDKKEEV